MAVFDGVSYSLSPSLSPTRRNELAAILDLNGAAPHPPYSHIIAPAASHAHADPTIDQAVKLVTDRWVDRSIVMGKRQPEQYYSPDPAMIFSGVVACATDLAAPDLEVLSAGITALGGQWRVGLTRDVTHLFSLRTGSDKYNTALHFAPQTHMCILTPHWFDDAVRLGRRIPETPYAWPDPPVLRPGVTLDLDDDGLATEGKRKRKPETGDTNASNEGEHVRVWAGRRILLSASLELAGGSRRAIEARIQRAGGIVVPLSDDADEDAEEKAVVESDVLVTRWRSGKSYFKAARASLLIGTLSWLFSVESSGALHSPLDSLLWYPTPKGGIPDLIDCEISITNYTGAARDYLKRLIVLVGAKFTPSMSQSNKVLIAGFQPSPKTARALAWSIPVVNHTWLEDCFVEWRALTVGLERYIMYPPGVDFGKMLMTGKEPPPSSQSVPPQGLSGGAVPGGRGIGSINLEQEETRDVEYRARGRKGVLGLSRSRDTHAAAVDGSSMVMSDAELLTDRARPRSRAGSVKRTPSLSTNVRRGPGSVSATGAFVDHVIELPTEDDLEQDQRPKQRARTGSDGPRAVVSRRSSFGLFSTAEEGDVDRVSGGQSKDGHGKDKGKGVDTRNAEDPQAVQPPKSRSRLVQRKTDAQTAHTDDDEVEKPVSAEKGGGPLRRGVAERMGIRAEAWHSEASEGDVSEVPAPPRRPTGAGSATPVKSGMKPRPRSQSRTRSVLGESDEVVPEAAEAVATKGKEPPATGRNGKGKNKTKEQPTDKAGKGMGKGKGKGKGKETTKVASRARSRSPTRSPSPTTPGTKTARTPKRQLSVLVPSVPKDYFSSQSGGDGESDDERERSVGTRGDVALGTKRRQLGPQESMHAVAAETSTSASKRGKPSPAKVIGSVAGAGVGAGKSKTPAKAKGKPKAGASKDTKRTRGEDDEEVETSTIVSSTSRAGPRRSAANKATTRLRDEVMPDVVSFEKEQKQAKRRRSVGGESVASMLEEVVREERVGKRRKVETQEEEEEEEAEVVDVVLAPPAKVKGKSTLGKGKAKATTAPSDEGDVDAEKDKPSGSQERKGGRGRGKEVAAVRVITTGVSLSDDVVKKLTRLGVQMTTKPTDCTHLIAKGIVRTEKFLCAMSVSPYILTEEWANASAKSGKLLAEHDYILSDVAAEKKWAFKFSDALARAKSTEGGANLFKHMTFYVTPKVAVDAKLLKNVICAGGGQVQISTTPTVRILKGKGHRYVVSCEEDKGIWRALAQEGFKIYSPELVLRGALRQEVEWERDECVVAG